MLQVIIARPTRLCNADCFYCAAPPDGFGKWKIENFYHYFDSLVEHLDDFATWIWHGGEPMLMGPEFFIQAHEYALAKKPNLKFAIQSNLLSYSANPKWKEVFEKYFKHSISSSYDPDKEGRTVKGSTDKFQKLFLRSLEKLITDGFNPMLIATISNKDLGENGNIDALNDFYEWNKQYNLPLRFNYCYPSGKLGEKIEYITHPNNYGQALVNLYDKWISDFNQNAVNFTITPFDQMIKVICEDEINFCPWLSNCGGKFLEIEPNGDVYNCSDFADLKRRDYSFGNLKDNTYNELMRSKPALEIKKRMLFLPSSCQRCEHQKECQGGCSAQVVMFKQKITNGKFPYCLSWKQILTRVKQSILSSEADKFLLSMYTEQKVNEIKKNLRTKIASFYNLDSIEEQSLEKANSAYGFFDNKKSFDNDELKRNHQIHADINNLLNLNLI
jgi:uncharacterized protein